MLFEKNKENLEIITWYHKSFSSAPRVSELGREGAGRREAGKVMQFASCQDALTSAVWGVLIQVKPALPLAYCKLKKTLYRGC